MSLLTRSPRIPAIPAASALAPEPPCPWCAIGMHAVDHRQQALWLCDSCGTTMRRP